MKTIVFVLALSTLVAIFNAQTLTVSSTDSTTTDFPVTLTTGGTSYAFSQGSATSTPAITLSGTTTTYTAAYKSGTGIPLQQTWLLTGSGAALGILIQLTVGPQVAFNIATANLNGYSSGSLQASAAAVTQTASTTTCGNYYVDCAAGVLYFQLAVPATSGATCSLGFTQVGFLYIGLQYATAPSSTALTLLASSIGSGTYCGTYTNNGQTVVLFTQSQGTSATTSSLSSAASALNILIKAKLLFNVSGRLLEEEGSGRMLATYTLTGGFANGVAASSSAGTTAPSSTIASSITANNTSQNRVVAVAGFVIATLAAFLGFAL